MAIINGTSADNTLNGTADADQINGLAGNDLINALTRPTAPGSGIDVVDGGDGNDTLVVNASGETQSVQFGTGFAPTFTVSSNSGNFLIEAYNMELVRFTGGSGNDTINTGDHRGTVNGGGGSDHWLADLSHLSTAVLFTLGATPAIAAAGVTSIVGIERVNLTTGGGNDIITGGALADSILTGDGNDTINLKTRTTGTDVADGGDGTDTLVVDASAETQAVNLNIGSAPTFTVSSVSGNFSLEAYNMEKVKFTGGAGDDTINTGAGGVTVRGGGGSDHWIADLSQVATGLTFTLGTTTALGIAGLASISGIERIALTTGSGADTIVGGALADSINTGAGNDSINLKTRTTGTDVADGGLGTDTLIVDASAESQAVTLNIGSAPTFSMSSVSGNFSLEAYNMEKVKFIGGAGDDTIHTSAFGVTVNGGGGSDHWIADLSELTTAVTFTLGTTTAIAAAGLTSILGIERINLTAGSGNDVMTGGALADRINSGAGDDTINLRTRTTGTDVADGGLGIDTLVVDASAETQAVTLNIGSSPNFAVSSVSGNFSLEAYNVEKVKFTGGSGDDTINTGFSGGAVNGGGGSDHWLADLSHLSTAVLFTLGSTPAITAAGVTSIFGIERINLTTGSGNDIMTGGSLADRINTGDGNDTINLKTRTTGTDVADGGAGIDTLVVDASAETQAVTLNVGSAPTFAVSSVSGNFSLEAYNVEKVRFTGGGGDDTINTGAGGVMVHGGGGSDHWIADLSQVATGLTFTLGTTTALGIAGLASISGIERIALTTGSGADTIVGGALADSINTGAGNDSINLKTRTGGTDVADGGLGTDTLVIDASAETQAVTLNAGFSPTFAVTSASGNFNIEAYNMEKVKFTGGSGIDTASGNGWDDELRGGGGTDTLNGGYGNDLLDGGDQNDLLRGGRGIDQLTGGNGNDILDYDSVTESSVATGLIDHVQDFQTGLDLFDLSSIDANARGVDGNQAFTFIGGAAFSGVRGELRSVGGTVEADLNGDAVADFRILLDNGATASTFDFIL
jgi:Ca2+-binding RTX toxin-like protein